MDSTQKDETQHEIRTIPQHLRNISRSPCQFRGGGSRMAWRIVSRARLVISSAAAELRTGARRSSRSPALGSPHQGSASGSFTGLGWSRSEDEKKREKERFRDKGVTPVHCENYRKFSTAKHEERKTSDAENGDKGGRDNEEFFNEIKQRFLSFKKNKFLKEVEHYQNLAKIQSPKFMVVACADSRVCPSNILGFEPGEALTVRNVANLVPQSEFGPSETSAALEFAVKSLEVKNILVIGHSNCAGIEALMSMDDTESRSYTDKWLINGKAAKLRTKSSVAHLDFYQQCKHCEKESVNESLQNLLTYPWIKERVGKEELVLHGGYYDFINCTFDKWTLHLEGQTPGEGHRLSIRDHTFWC